LRLDQCQLPGRSSSCRWLCYPRCLASIIRLAALLNPRGQKSPLLLPKATPGRDNAKPESVTGRQPLSLSQRVPPGKHSEDGTCHGES
jgi:hypothetical protein